MPLAGGSATKFNSAVVAGGDIVNDFEISPDSSQVVYLADQDYDVPSMWRLVEETLLPDLPIPLFNVTTSDSMAVGGMVSLNDLRSVVETYINNADVDSMGDIALSAAQSATINAINESVAASTGGSVFATGDGGDSGGSLAVNGVIATNLVQSGANAWVVDSDLNAAGGGKVFRLMPFQPG